MVESPSGGYEEEPRSRSAWIAVIIVVIIVVVAIGVGLIIYFATRKTNPLNTVCGGGSNCPSGYVCDAAFSPPLCKVGQGGICVSTSDCGNGLVCSNFICQTGIPANGNNNPNHHHGNTGDYHPYFPPPPFCPIETRSQISTAPGPSETTKHSLTGPEAISYPSTQRDSSSVSVPYHVDKRGDRAVCRGDRCVAVYNTNDGFDEKNNMGTPITMKGKRMKDSAVVDIVTFSDSNYFLLDDGHIIKEGNNSNQNCDQSNSRKRIKCNIYLESICSFNGYLFGIHDKELYSLDMVSFTKLSWKWSKCTWISTGNNGHDLGVRYINTTLDNQYLWIQDDMCGYLYDNNYQMVTKMENFSHRRIYGMDPDHYLDIDETSCSATLMPGNIKIADISGGVLNHAHEVIHISSAERNTYRGIRLINWIPYYLSF